MNKLSIRKSSSEVVSDLMGDIISSYSENDEWCSIRFHNLLGAFMGAVENCSSDEMEDAVNVIAGDHEQRCIEYLCLEFLEQAENEVNLSQAEKMVCSVINAARDGNIKECLELKAVGLLEHEG